MKRKCLMIILSVLFIISCDSIKQRQLNENNPDYIKSVNAYKEGSDGILVYFILADVLGSMTTSDGVINITITPEDYDCLIVYGNLYKKSYTVKKDDFKKTKVGIGAFEHEVILCMVGRIIYSSFKISNPLYKSKTLHEIIRIGKVNIEFITPDGKILKGEETVYF